MDQAEPVAGDLPVVVVGGGAALIDRIPGVKTLVPPETGWVANAVGAAFAQAGGEVDRVYSLTGRTRAEIVSDARDEAIQRACQAGAQPDSVNIVDEEAVPLTHLHDGTALHVRVKAIEEIWIGVLA